MYTLSASFLDDICSHIAIDEECFPDECRGPLTSYIEEELRAAALSYSDQVKAGHNDDWTVEQARIYSEIVSLPPVELSLVIADIEDRLIFGATESEASEARRIEYN